MRRSLLPLLLLSLAPFAGAADAGCDEETGECHAVDCVAWDPRQAPEGVLGDVAAGDYAHAVTWLTPPPCPS